MCVPISVVTQGTYSCPVGGNHGILAAQIIGLVGLVGAMGWTFKGFLGRLFGFGTARE